KAVGKDTGKWGIAAPACLLWSVVACFSIQWEIYSAAIILYVSKRRSWRWTVDLARGSRYYACSSRHLASFVALESERERFGSGHPPHADRYIHPDRILDAHRQPAGSPR